MSGPSEEMKAAFPPKTSPGAERLCEAISWTDENPQVICEDICAVLGITEEVVERLQNQASSMCPCFDCRNANHVPATALSTLLEVAEQKPPLRDNHVREMKIFP